MLIATEAVLLQSETDSRVRSSESTQTDLALVPTHVSLSLWPSVLIALVPSSLTTYMQCV